MTIIPTIAVNIVGPRTPVVGTPDSVAGIVVLVLLELVAGFGVALALAFTLADGDDTNAGSLLVLLVEITKPLLIFWAVPPLAV